MRNDMIGTGVLAAAALLLAGAAPLAATDRAAETGWLPWLGCWQPVAGAEAVEGEDHTVCFVATGEANAVEVITLEAGAIVSRELMRVDGSRRSIEEGGCTGWEVADWSADGHRVYLQSELSCEGLPRRATGLLAMASATEWLDIQAVAAGAGNADRGVRVVRYRTASQAALEAHGITAVGAERALVTQTARQAAAAPVTIAMVREAVDNIAREAVSAWLIERQAEFALNAATLIELADAGVPTDIIDLMVALSNPQVFAIDHAGRTELRPVERATMSEEERARRAYDRGYYGPRRPGSWYGYDPYYGYGYSPYGRYGFGNFYGGYTPVIVIVRPDGDDAPATRLRAVRGRGYSAGSGSGGSASGTASPRSGSSSGTATSSSGTSGASSQPASSSGSSGRTARPRRSGDPEKP